MNWSGRNDGHWREFDWDAWAAQPPRRRLASVLGLGVLAALLPGLLGVLWLADDLTAEAQRESVLGDKLAQQRATAATLPALRQQSAALYQALHALEPALVTAGAVPGLWLQVQARAQTQALQLDAFEPSPPVPQPEYTALPATLRLRGSYGQLVRFAASLATGTPAVNVRRWSLLPGPDGRLTADLALVVFQRVGDRSAAESSTEAVALPPATLPPAVAQAMAQLADPFANQPLPSKLPPPAPFQLASLSATGPLQGALLQDFTLVGTLAQDGRTFALLRLGGRVYPAKVGDLLGPDQGEVVRIDASELVLREWVRQPGGAWARRETRMVLGRSAS